MKLSNRSPQSEKFFASYHGNGVGDRVTTRGGELGTVIAVDVNNGLLTVSFDNQGGTGDYRASEVTCEAVAAGFSESRFTTAGEPFHFASEDYPELGDILVERPPLAHSVSNAYTMTASRKEAHGPESGALSDHLRSGHMAERTDACGRCGKQLHWEPGTGRYVDAAGSWDCPSGNQWPMSERGHHPSPRYGPGSKTASRKTAAVDLDEMVAQYVETALWATERTDDPWGTAEPSPTFEAQAEHDCEKFLQLCQERGVEPLADSGQNGHTFWLTRSGHGAGFWDRGLGAQGEALSEIAKTFGEADPYKGDDGMIYLGSLRTASAPVKCPKCGGDTVVTSWDGDCKCKKCGHEWKNKKTAAKPQTQRSTCPQCGHANARKGDGTINCGNCGMYLRPDKS